MTEGLPTPADSGGVISEWLGFLKALPGAANAIFRVLKGSGDAGNAWIDIAQAAGEQRAQAIRDLTAARAEFTKGVVQAATQRAIENTAILDRAIGRLSSTLIAEQKNVEEIARLTVQSLQDCPPCNSSSEPDEDWLNVFSALAARASSETLREHWAQILAGEIRKPGSFSLSTLQIMSVMDKNLAGIVVRVWPAVFNEAAVATVGRFGRGSFYHDLVTLDALGVVRVGMHAVFYKTNAEGYVELIFGRKALVLGGRHPGQEFRIRGAILTRAGSELSAIVPFGQDVSILREIGIEIRREIHAKSVFLADYDLTSRSVQLSTAELIDGDAS